MVGQIHWTVIGDFNAIISHSEKSVDVSKGKRCPFFGDFVDSSELHDLGFSGPPFTWHRGTLFERLDRALENEAWIRNFPNCMVYHLPKIKSDHSPLLMVLNPSFIPPRGGAVCEWVRKVFDGTPIKLELNNTLIVLIPKFQNPETFGHFRPISLCLVLYKLTMKVIANRFKFIFPKIIAPEQAGFIAGRNINDNIIIAQEVIHSMRYQEKRKWMAIKIDLEKAYDKVSWELIEVSLHAAGIPEYLISVIMNSISNSTMQVMWNGAPLPKFRPVRGIRQGCPLSPYLFVLCMEWLGHMIKSTISGGIWDPIRLSRDGLSISHLFFIDDLVIFSRADPKHCSLLKRILDRFCSFSGHKINIRKTSIFFSKGVDESSMDLISRFFGFQRVHNLGQYLGVSILHQRVTSSTLKFVVEKVRVFIQKILCTFYEIVWLLRMFGPTLIQEESFVIRKEIGSLDTTGSWVNVQSLMRSYGCILDSLKIIQRRGHAHVIIQTDSLEVVKSTLGNPSIDSNSYLIRRIRKILSQEDNWILKYIPKEHNQVADCLAKQALLDEANLQTFEAPPEFTNSVYNRDRPTGSCYF
ncbi:hypothetical protein J1N35_021318 [Gossypium stocksii]|uniref:Reverse transcriptase domain-containing protein n=1 Tax=Gossypium stocksii TaxID=47602 RepID=A0A9D3VFH4_9ROSI|nr:hypothetical protein J1N35_021318 [Gossypium stocksii]